MKKFRNREDAAEQLAAKLVKYRSSSAVVLAIPRGGVPVGCYISKKLGLPVEVMLSKKIGHPLSREVAIGAVSMGSVILTGQAMASDDYIESEVRDIKRSLKEKYELYIGEREQLELAQRDVIIVDDGIATGSTVLAIIELVRTERPSRIIIAVPVAAPDTVQMLETRVDEVVCAMIPADFSSVSQFYEEFRQVSDDEVVRMLRDAHSCSSS
jgi:putative phosphoribosyl transferase